MNTTDTLTTLFRHNRWANERILERCAGLTDEKLDATIVGTYGSIRDTLQHIATAERSYFSRISTGQPYRRPEGAPPLTIAEMTESVRTSGSGLIEGAPRCKPATRCKSTGKALRGCANDDPAYPGNQPRHRTPPGDGNGRVMYCTRTLRIALLQEGAHNQEQDIGGQKETPFPQIILLHQLQNIFGT